MGLVFLFCVVSMRAGSGRAAAKGGGEGEHDEGSGSGDDESWAEATEVGGDDSG